MRNLQEPISHVSYVGIKNKKTIGMNLSTNNKIKTKVNKKKIIAETILCSDKMNAPKSSENS